VRLGRGVRIGPYAVIESGAEIGDGASIGAHVVVGAGARVGAGSTHYPHDVLYPGTELGARVILHSGSAVGVDGFGYAPKDGRPAKVPQVGRCVIEDDVEVGANTTIDRGSIGTTRVGRGAKLDNLVQIAHNVTVGPAALLAAQVGVAGSSRVGAGVLAGGQAGIAGHLTVGDGAQLAAQAGVVTDIPPGQIVMGFPARPRTEFLRATAGASKVSELAKRVAALERSRGEG
jgi:UDP-3-O-[3-hydroxymyristoyl] glucosamine N-acyltransferase